MTNHRTTSHFNLETDRILSPKEVMKRTSLSRSSLARLARDGEFPRPFPLSARRVGWSEYEVTAWIAKQKAGN